MERRTRAEDGATVHEGPARAGKPQQRRRRGPVADAPAPEVSESERDAIAGKIRSRLAQFEEVGLPKYMQLRKAIVASIDDRVLKPGDQLPPEEVLTSVLGVSLGTVRRALAHLAAGGFITREHGRGTFISSHQKAIGDSWHFRFLSEGKEDLLPVYSHALERSIIHQQGPWQDRLGSDPKGYVRIKRTFNVDNELLCYSEFYLKAGRFRGMVNLSLDEMESVNLKKVLAEKFGTPTLHVVQRLRVEPFSDEICEMLSMDRRANGLFLEIVAYTYDDVPISYHRVYVPPSELLMDLSNPNLGKLALAKVV